MAFRLTMEDVVRWEVREHRQNAEREMPVSVFVEAVHLARSVSFEEGSEFGWGGGAGNCERHPAMQLLAGWWNGTVSQELRSASFAAPFVRRDGFYLCACPDMVGPSMIGSQNPAVAARVGDHILLQFVRSYAEGTRNGYGWKFVDVSGAMWLDAAVADDERDEAYYCLVALERLPDEFPETWASLTNGAASSSSSMAPISS